MPSELKALHRPRSLPEAIELLEQHGDRARPLAGGTALVLGRSPRVEVLVDLALLGLDRIEASEEELRIGAMASCSAVRRWFEAEPAGWPAMLGEAAAAIGSRILQNHVTVGGNCVMVYAWSDLPVALWCLDARFVAVGKGGSRTLGADRFFAEHPSHVLGSGEILTEVVVPRPPRGAGSAYVKVTRNATDHGLASAAAVVVLGPDRTVLSARIALGAVRGLPQLLPAAAAAVIGHQAPASECLAAAGRAAQEEAKVTADFRAGAEYRKDLVATVVEDALERALARAAAARQGGAA
jgi:carbon-monoxide dehydrogenase medium subunit